VFAESLVLLFGKQKITMRKNNSVHGSTVQHLTEAAVNCTLSQNGTESSAMYLDAVTELAGVHLFCSPRQGFPRSFWSALIRSEANGNGVASPDMVSKHSKEELIAFFRDIQTSIAESSPKASKRTRKQPPDPLKEVHRREQSHGMSKPNDAGVEFFSEMGVLQLISPPASTCCLFSNSRSYMLFIML